MNLKSSFGLAALLGLSAATATAGVSQADPAALARAIVQKHLLVDTHVDVPYRLEEQWEDVTGATREGDFDYPRAQTGGLNVPFMSIYTPAESEQAGTSFQTANTLIDSVEALVGRAPEKFALAKTSSAAAEAAQSGLIALAMGMENGSPLEGKLENIAFFKRRGISYITLTHSLSNHISDSSYDEERQWQGLSPFGKEVVVEMNRQGIMIDISHVSDEAFWQVLELSNVPLIASHSSARHFTPGFERNMSDEMIRAMAAKGGVVQINFGSSFLTQEAREWYDRRDAARTAFLEANGFDEEGEESERFSDDYRDQHVFPYATLSDVVTHFQHVIDLAGIDHVGIGSDFDGVGDSLPVGMKDVADYPNLVEALLKLEFTVEDIAKIMGGNLMRVWRAAEVYSRESSGESAVARAH
ncbi:MAG: membrane dipeptidase [Xanthomonadales bacterium]|nr:membrane dipeptidase [Xanthomonadales bacterium]